MLIPHPIKQTSYKCIEFIFQLQISLHASIQATQLMDNMLHLQASVDEVYLSGWALTVPIGITAPKQTMLLIRSTSTNIGGQAFAIVTTWAESNKNLYKINLQWH